MRPKKILEAKFEARPIFEARPKFGLRPKYRPTLRPGQLWGQARPMGPGQWGQARFYSMPTNKLVSWINLLVYWPQWEMIFFCWSQSYDLEVIFHLTGNISHLSQLSRCNHTQSLQLPYSVISFGWSFSEVNSSLIST